MKTSALYLGLFALVAVIEHGTSAESLSAEPGRVSKPARFGGGVADNMEQILPPNETFILWAQDESLLQPRGEDKVEVRKKIQQHAKTHKLDGLVPPLGFASWQAAIPDSYITKLRVVLNKMRNHRNVRLHIIGHTDNSPLREAAKAKYQDNMGLSKARAAYVAEYFQRALGLAPDAVSFDGAGESKPMADNRTAAGKSKNRRVEVQVWYDEISEKVVEEKVLIPAPRLNRVKVCRRETVCKLRYNIGSAKRAKLKNLVPPLRLAEGQVDIPAAYIHQIREVMKNLAGKKNLSLRFIGHTDNLPLNDAELRIYGKHKPLSKARARRVALAVQDAMHVPNRMIQVDGKGQSRPLATNSTIKGRALNRRVELQFWYDDPYDQLSDEPQACPDSEAAETVTLVYEPPSGPLRPLVLIKGQPRVPAGYLQRVKNLLDEVTQKKANARLRFVGYTGNKRLERRIAMVYKDDIGLSTARAKRTARLFQNELKLREDQIVYEGRGYVHSKDVVNSGFIQLQGSQVDVEIIYDELAELEEDEGLDIKRIHREATVHDPYALNLMRITVDGRPVHDPYKHVADIQRCTDVAFDKADIRFQFDNLSLKPRLSISAWPPTIRYRDDPDTKTADDVIRFQGYANYRHFIERAEVRIYDDQAGGADKPLAVVALDDYWRGQWQARQEHYRAPGRVLSYVLRVYDKHGRFDQTRAQPLWLVDRLDRPAADTLGEQVLAGYGDNRLAMQHIPLQGGTVTVHGHGIPAGHEVWIAGRPVPVNAQGRFVGEEIFPPGLYTVEVAVLDKQGNGTLYLRDLGLKKSSWFYVGIADITVVKDDTNGPARLVTGDQSHYDNDLRTEGRLAFYSRGKFGGDWQLTAAADSREGPIEDILKDFSGKTPDSLFRQMDTDYYYPSFGDDSTVEEGAPTMGKLYIKLQKQKSYGLWGNFFTKYHDTELSQIDRGLYGANLHYESASITGFGEQRFFADGFAAEPGTVAGRDDFRGTGGSLYFLRHQNIVSGSQQVRVEVRDKDSGQVLGVKNLLAAVDYDIDTIQGRLLLSQPLAGTADDGLLVDSGGVSGNPIYLVVRYEYAPGFEALNDIAGGGRIHYWLGDYIKLGATTNAQEETGNKQHLNGVDLTMRLSAGSWMKVELAESRGQGIQSLASQDGGFNYTALDRGLDVKAQASRVEARASLSDMFVGGKGSASFYVQNREGGFSAPGQLAATEVDQAGGQVRLPVTDKVNVKVKADSHEQEQALKSTAVEMDAGYQLNTHWRFSAGSRYDSREDRSPALAQTRQTGDRVDLTMHANYNSLTRWQSYGFAQTTTQTTGNREKNNRVGGGGSYRINDRFKMLGELSGGNYGLGAQWGTDYLLTNSSHVYLNYALENERSDNGARARQGSLVSGFRSRYRNHASVYVEERYHHGDVPTGLTHAFGVDLVPAERWNLGATAETGELEDLQTAVITRREAYGLTLGYGRQSTRYASALQYRRDQTQSSDTATRTTWLIKNSLNIQLTDAARMIGKLNISDSKSSQGEFYDGNFIDAVLGYGYRPVSHDRLNTLFKYTYFYNVPTTEQVNVQNTAVEYIQKSHILSLDTVYDISKRWSLGGKYAYRLGQLSQQRIDPEFFDSRASLYVLRADWHFVHRWDLLLETRMLDLPDAGDTRSGALFGIYRHVGKHLKLGVGYNFSDFSDDLTDQDFDSQGYFINLIGKI